MSVSVSLTCGHGKEACWPLAHEKHQVEPISHSFSSHKSSHHRAASPLNQMPGCYLLAQRPLPLSTRSEPMVRSLCEHEHALLHRGHHASAGPMHRKPSGRHTLALAFVACCELLRASRWVGVETRHLQPWGDFDWAAGVAGDAPVGHPMVMLLLLHGLALGLL